MTDVTRIKWVEEYFRSSSPLLRHIVSLFFEGGIKHWLYFRQILKNWKGKIIMRKESVT